MAYNSSSAYSRLREKHEKHDKFSKYDTEELKSYIRRQKELRRLRVLQEYEERARLLESKQQRLKELDQKCKQIAHKKQQKRNEARFSYPVSKSVGDPKEYVHRENGGILHSDSKHAVRHFDSKSTGFEDVGDTNLRRKSSKRELDTKPVKSASKLEKEAANFIFKEFENIVRRECKNLLRTRSAQFGSRSQSSCSLQSEVKDEADYSRKPATSRSKPEKVPTEDKNVGTSFSLYNYMESRSENGIDLQQGKTTGGYQLYTGRSLSCASVSGVRQRSSSQNMHSVLPQTFDFELGPYFANDLSRLDKISERKKHEAAMKIQAAYKSYRMRKMLAEAKLRPQKSRIFDQNYLQEVAKKLNGMLEPSKDLSTPSAMSKYQNTNGYGTTPTRSSAADHISPSLSRSRQQAAAKKSLETVTHIPQPRQKMRQEQVPIHIKPTRLTSRTMNDSSNPPSSTSKSNDIIPGYIPPPPEIGLISRPVITAPRTLPMMRMKQVDEPFPKHLEGHSFSGNQRSDFVSSSPSPLKLISSISKFQLPHSLKSNHAKEEKSPRIEELVKSQHNSITQKTDVSQLRVRTPLQSQAESFRETLLHLRKLKQHPVTNVNSVPPTETMPSAYSHVLDLPDPAFAMVLQEKLRLMREQAEVKPKIFTTPVVPSPVRKSQMIAVSKATEQIKLKIAEAKQILEDYKNELLRCNDFSVVSNLEDPTYESDFDTDMPSQSLSNQIGTGLRSESEVAQIRSEESLIRTKSSKTVSPRKPQVAVKPTTSQSSTEAPRNQEMQPLSRSRKSTSPNRSTSNATYLTSLQSRKLESLIETSARRSLHVPTDVNTGTNVLPVASVKPGGRKSSSKEIREQKRHKPREKAQSPTSMTDRTEDGVDEVDQDADSMSHSSKELLEESETDYEDIVPSASKASGNLQTEDINYDTDFDSDMPSTSVSKPPVSVTIQKKDAVPSIIEDDEIKEDFIASEPVSGSQGIESRKSASVHHLSSIQESVSRSTVDQSSQVILNELSEVESEALQKSVQSTADKNVQSEVQESNGIVDEHVSYASEFDTDIPSTSKKLAAENLPADESESIQVDMQESVKDSTIREELQADGSEEESIAYEVSVSMKPSPPIRAEIRSSGVSQDKPAAAPKKDIPILKIEDLNLSNVTDSSAVSDISTPKDIDDIMEMILADDSSEAGEMEDKVLESAISDVLDKEKPRDAVQDVTDISPLGYTQPAESQSQKDHDWLTPMPEIQNTDFPAVNSVSEVTDAEEDWLSKQSVLENTVDKSTPSSLIQVKVPAPNSEPIGAGGDQDDMSDDEYVEEFLSCKPMLGSKSAGLTEFEATNGSDVANQEHVTLGEANTPINFPFYDHQESEQVDQRLKEDVYMPQQSAEDNISSTSSVSFSSDEKVEDVTAEPKAHENLDQEALDGNGKAHEENILELAKTVDSEIVEKIESMIVDEISKHIDGDSVDSEHSQATEVEDSKYSLNSRTSNFYVEEVVYESDFDSEMVSEKSEQSKQKSFSESAASSRRSSKLEAVVKDEVERFVTNERAKFDAPEEQADKSEVTSEFEVHDNPSAVTFELRLQNTIENKEVIDALLARILQRIFREVVAADKQAASDTDVLKQKFADAVHSIDALSPILKPANEDEVEVVPEEIDACAEWFEDDLLTSGQEVEEESLKLEAAKIVAEQQRIENEIRALEALQAQVPSSLLGLPELPDKPPPPYTPPSAESIAVVQQPYTIQCTTEELEEKVVKIVHKFWDRWQQEGKCINAQELEDENQDLAASKEDNAECNDSCRQDDKITSSNHTSPSEISTRAFNTFLQDLILDTVKEIMLIEDLTSPTSKSYLDRIRPGSLALEAAKLRVPRTREALISSTLKRIMNLLPYPLLASYVPVQRKRLTKWTSRPRDLVDEVLAEELIEEDREWTESWPEEILVLDRWTDKFTRRALFEVLTVCKTVFS